MIGFEMISILAILIIVIIILLILEDVWSQFSYNQIDVFFIQNYTLHACFFKQVRIDFWNLTFTLTTLWDVESNF